MTSGPVASERAIDSVPAAPVRWGWPRRAAALSACLGLLCLAGGLLPVSQVILGEGVLVLVLFALSTNLLLGQGGLLSFGQGVFFGAGAYTVALGWLHYQTPFPVLMALAPVVGCVSALVVGLVALRTDRWFFSLVTLAFSQLAFTGAEEAYSYTQGDTGVFGAMIPQSLLAPRTNYFFVLLFVTLGSLALFIVRRSRFGLVLLSIKENRTRMASLGVNVYRHQVAAFTIAGGLAGLAGALFAVVNQEADPQLLSWLQSGDPVFAAVIGGTDYFAGPIIGAFVLQYGRDLALQYTTHWELVLGLILLAVIMVRPSGLWGLSEPLLARTRGVTWRRRGR
jgi:branched-chain amino acid transport system permease protein